MPCTVNIVASQNWIKVGDMKWITLPTSKDKGCPHNPKDTWWPLPTLYHCPECYVILFAGLAHPNTLLTKLLLDLQEIGFTTKAMLKKKFPKRPNVESWLREDGNNT